MRITINIWGGIFRDILTVHKCRNGQLGQVMLSFSKDHQWDKTDGHLYIRGIKLKLSIDSLFRLVYNLDSKGQYRK